MQNYYFGDIKFLSGEGVQHKNYINKNIFSGEADLSPNPSRAPHHLSAITGTNPYSWTLTDARYGINGSRAWLLTSVAHGFPCVRHGQYWNRSRFAKDYRKAFDTVPHARLIQTLKSLGISGKLLVWITNFLHLRKMRARVRISFSEWVEVLSGVPQGSVLGPFCSS